MTLKLLTAICLVSALTSPTVVAKTAARSLGNTSNILEALVESRNIPVNIETSCAPRRTSSFANTSRSLAV